VNADDRQSRYSAPKSLDRDRRILKDWVPAKMNAAFLPQPLLDKT